MFDSEIIVTKIVLALFLPDGRGRPIHKNRPTHGLAFNVGCASSYSFDNGRTLICRAGECIYLPKGSNYIARRCDRAENKSGVYAINFLTLSENEVREPWVVRIKGEDEMLSSFSRATRAWMKRESGFYEDCFSALYKIMRQLKRESAQYAPVQKSAELLAPALKYIDENCMNEKISILHLAKLCGVSEVYLRRTFQNAFSVSPAVYMRNRRISYAKTLLETEEYSVTDVAMLSGFNDTAYFAREFKKTVGVTPSAYRKEMEE